MRLMISHLQVGEGGLCHVVAHTPLKAKGDGGQQAVLQQVQHKPHQSLAPLRGAAGVEVGASGGPRGGGGRWKQREAGLRACRPARTATALLSARPPYTPTCMLRSAAMHTRTLTRGGCSGGGWNWRCRTPARMSDTRVPPAPSPATHCAQQGGQGGGGGGRATSHDRRGGAGGPGGGGGGRATRLARRGGAGGHTRPCARLEPPAGRGGRSESQGCTNQGGKHGRCCAP